MNRPYIDLTLTGPNGRRVTTHAWVDSGGGAMLLSASLAKRLGLKPVAKATHAEGHLIAPVKAPALRIGHAPVTLVNPGAFVVLDAPKTLGHTDAEAALPGRFLQHYIVVFDYPAQTLTLAEAGALKPTGSAIKAYIGDSGMPVVWLSVGGKSWGFLLDTGGQDSMISSARLDAWAGRHPDWHRVAGAYGPANMLLGDPRTAADLRMLNIGSMQWGPFALKNVVAVSRPPGVYEKWMSKMLGQPIIGSIAGNVLRDFRVTINYPLGTIHLTHSAASGTAHLDMVPIMLAPTSGGGYKIASTTRDAPGARVDDVLIGVDDHAAAGAPFSTLVGRLSGTLGQKHVLVLQRDGKTIPVVATGSSIF